MEPLLVLTNCPDAATARTIAEAVVEARLVACVNILAPVQSVYRWQGKVESAVEIPLFFKSTAANYERLAETIRTLHPYEVPEIIALPITHGLPAYLNWLAAETIQ